MALFRNVLKEHSIPVKNASKNDTIHRLRQLDAVYDPQNASAAAVTVTCSAKGRLRVESTDSVSLILRGEVTEQDGQTYIRICEVKDRTRWIPNLLVLLLGIVLLLLDIFVELSVNAGSWLFYGALILWGIDLIDCIACLVMGKPPQTEPFPAMLDEVRRRIDIVENWEK